MQQIPVPLVIVGIFLLFIFAKMALRIIRPFEKGLVEFLGKTGKVNKKTTVSHTTVLCFYTLLFSGQA